MTLNKFIHLTFYHCQWNQLQSKRIHNTPGFKSDGRGDIVSIITWHPFNISVAWRALRLSYATTEIKWCSVVQQKSRLLFTTHPEFLRSKSARHSELKRHLNKNGILTPATAAPVTGAFSLWGASYFFVQKPLFQTHLRALPGKTHFIYFILFLNTNVWSSNDAPDISRVSTKVATV